MSPKQRSQKLTDKNIKEYSTYKLVILYFALIDQLYEKMFVRVPNSGNEADWPSTLADWIRHNDDVLIKVTNDIFFLMKNDFTEKIHKRFKKNEFTEKINLFFFFL